MQAEEARNAQRDSSDNGKKRKKIHRKIDTSTLRGDSRENTVPSLWLLLSAGSFTRRALFVVLMGKYRTRVLLYVVFLFFLLFLFYVLHKTAKLD